MLVVCWCWLVATLFITPRRWVYCAVRGMDDDEPVVVKELSKSLNSCKSFAATCEESAVCSWLAVLAAELSERMSEDETEHGRRARTLGVLRCWQTPITHHAGSAPPCNLL